MDHEIWVERDRERLPDRLDKIYAVMSWNNLQCIPYISPPYVVLYIDKKLYAHTRDELIGGVVYHLWEEIHFTPSTKTRRDIGGRMWSIRGVY